MRRAEEGLDRGIGGGVDTVRKQRARRKIKCGNLGDGLGGSVVCSWRSPKNERALSRDLYQSLDKTRFALGIGKRPGRNVKIVDVEVQSFNIFVAIQRDLTGHTKLNL